MNTGTYSEEQSWKIKFLAFIAGIYSWLSPRDRLSLGNLPVHNDRFGWRDPSMWGRAYLSLRYIRGKGIQIAPRSSPVPVYFGTQVQYLDRWSTTHLRQHFPEYVSQPLVDPHIVDDTEFLSTIGSESLQFLISFNIVEFSEDPIRLIETYLSKIAPGGVLYLAISDKDKTLNCRRPSTSIDHLLMDYEHGQGRERQVHYEEWLRLVGGITDMHEITHAVDRLDESHYEIPYHVWKRDDIADLLDYLRVHLMFPFEVITSLTWIGRESEVLYILKKNLVAQSSRGSYSRAA
jgi:hypothetical protein